MRICPKCGKTATDSDAFCTSCGTKFLGASTESSNPNTVPSQQNNLQQQNNLIDIQNKALQELTAIHKWVKFFGVLTIISLVISAITILSVTGILK